MPPLLSLLSIHFGAMDRNVDAALHAANRFCEAPHSFNPLPEYGCVSTQWRAMSIRRVIHTSSLLLHVVEQSLQPGGAGGMADQAHVHADRHHLRLRRALLVQHVEGVAEKAKNCSPVPMLPRVTCRRCW